jgi:hypothetical protein
MKVSRWLYGPPLRKPRRKGPNSFEVLRDSVTPLSRFGDFSQATIGFAHSVNPEVYEAK